MTSLWKHFSSLFQSSYLCVFEENMLRGQSRWINCHLNSLVCRILLMHSVSIQALMLSKSQFIINKQKIPIVVTLLSIVLQILIKYLPIWIPPDIRISGLLCWMWGKNRWDSYQGVSGGLRFVFFLTAQCNICLYMNNVGGSDWREWFL